MVISVLAHVKRCYSNADGDVIYHVIKSAFQRNEKVVVSFKGIESVSTSFVNSAFIELLNDYSFENIRANLTFIDSCKQINDMIKKRFYFEVDQRKNLLNV